MSRHAARVKRDASRRWHRATYTGFVRPPGRAARQRALRRLMALARGRYHLADTAIRDASPGLGADAEITHTPVDYSRTPGTEGFND